MSLFVPTDGILNTYVTWDDLQESVFEAFGKDAKLGPKKAVKDAGKKNGVYSKICLITPDWSGDAHGLPETFAVKICSLLTLAESKADMGDLGAFASEEFVNSMEGYLKTIHNTEVRLYKVLKQHGTDIPLPKVYFSQEFTEENPLKGYIIMDYINDGETFHIIDNLTPELLLEPLKALAKLEAVSLKFNVEEHALFANNPTIAAFSQFFSKEAIGGMVTMLHALAGEKLADTVDTLERIGGELSISLTGEPTRKTGNEACALPWRFLVRQLDMETGSRRLGTGSCCRLADGALRQSIDRHGATSLLESERQGSSRELGVASGEILLISTERNRWRGNALHH